MNRWPCSRARRRFFSPTADMMRDLLGCRSVEKIIVGGARARMCRPIPPGLSQRKHSRTQSHKTHTYLHKTHTHTHSLRGTLLPQTKRFGRFAFSIYNFRKLCPEPPTLFHFLHPLPRTTPLLASPLDIAPILPSSPPPVPRTVRHV